LSSVVALRNFGQDGEADFESSRGDPADRADCDEEGESELRNLGQHGPSSDRPCSRQVFRTCRGDTASLRLAVSVDDGDRELRGVLFKTTP